MILIVALLLLYVNQSIHLIISNGSHYSFIIIATHIIIMCFIFYCF